MPTMTDIFCGGGGSSTGGAMAGVKIDMAANHNALAVNTHQVNHPESDHACVDLHIEDPRFFPRTDILWASPECTRWSQAGGSKNGALSGVMADASLLDLLAEDDLITNDEDEATRSRLLMFDVLRFVEYHRYAAVIVENVVDIAMRAKYRRAWEAWRKGLTNLGYEHRAVSLNSMHAQAHGDPAPQSRDRLYIVCWLKGSKAPDIDKVMRPLAWCPACREVVESQQAWKNGRTVGKYRSQYVYIHGRCGTTVEPGYLPAAAAIDWTLRGTRIGSRTKPLAEKTRRRIAAGIARYWSPLTVEAAGNTYDAANPKHPTYGDPNGYYRAWSTLDVLRSIHTTASKALVVPLEGRAGDRCNSAAEPLRTQTARHQDAVALPPFMLERRFDYRVRGLDEPMSTLTANDTTKALIEPPFIAELRGGGSDARPTSDPLSTVTASGNHHALIMRNNGERGGHPARHVTPASEYLRTLTANGPLPSLLTPYYGSSEGSQPTDRPIGTLTTVDRYALIQRHNSSKGEGGEMVTPASEYLRTLTTKGHQSIITPGDIEAAEAQVDDCLFRMLEPREVAAGMAFPADYNWTDAVDEKGRHATRRSLVRLAGNAVTPPAARDLLAAVVESLS